MTNVNHSRRNVLASVGSVVVIGLSGCQGNIPGGKSKLQKQLDSVQDATDRYTDHKKALEDGFKVMGPFVPGMGWHFVHPKRLQQAAKNGFSIEKPQLLTYDSELNLGAAEWGAPTKAINETPDLFADENGDATEQWHPHNSATHVFALPDGKQTNPKNIPPKQFLSNDNWAEFRPPDTNVESGDTIELHWGSLKAKQSSPKEERIVDLAQTHPDLTTLHSWVHAENPEGIFSPVNPEFAQSKGDKHSH